MYNENEKRMNTHALTTQEDTHQDVSNCMSTDILVVPPGYTITEAAKLMKKEEIGSIVIFDPEASGFGLITERDIVTVVASGKDCLIETVGEHMSDHLITAAPDWDLDKAAEAMTDHKFRHLLVVDHGDVVGLLSMRDIVACRITNHSPTY